MPNKYIYEKMQPGEFGPALTKAGMTSSDAVKLFGRHYNQIRDYISGEGGPTLLESVVLDYLGEYPDATPIMLDMAEVRIIGQGKPR